MPDSCSDLPTPILRRVARSLLDEARCALAAGVEADADPSLGSGLCGVALAHWMLFEEWGDSEHRGAAMACLARAASLLEQVPVDASLCGGLVGVLFAHEVMGEPLGASFLSPIEDALVSGLAAPDAPGVLENRAPEAPGLAAHPSEWLYGLSGMAVALAELRPTEGRTRVITNLTRELVRRAQCAVASDSLSGLCPLHAADPHRPDLGFAHGAAGVLCALAGLNADVVPIAHLLLRHASNAVPAFPATAGAEPVDNPAWCYGDLGTLLALTTASATASEPRFANPIRASCMRILAAPLPPSWDGSLCHGDAGRILWARHIRAYLGERVQSSDAERGLDAWQSNALASLAHRLQEDAGPALLFARFSGSGSTPSEYVQDFSLVGGESGVVVALASRSPAARRTARLFGYGLARDVG